MREKCGAGCIDFSKVFEMDLSNWEYRDEPEVGPGWAALNLFTHVVWAQRLGLEATIPQAVKDLINDPMVVRIALDFSVEYLVDEEEKESNSW